MSQENVELVRRMCEAGADAPAATGRASLARCAQGARAPYCPHRRRAIPFSSSSGSAVSSIAGSMPMASIARRSTITASPLAVILFARLTGEPK